MSKLLKLILDWSEVWAVLIPLLVLLFHRKQPATLKPVIVYLWAALFINLTGDVIADFKKHFPDWLQSNNPLYNIHSLVRYTCFSYFFFLLKQPYFTHLKKILPYFSAVFIFINFTAFENFFNPNNLSGNLLSIEAYLLLVYCMFYYLSELKDEVAFLTSKYDFWVVTGLSIYVVINFFVFLFYVPMITQSPVLADNMWSIHNIAYILFCIFIAKAFYASRTS